MPDLLLQQIVKEYPTRGEPLVVLDGVNLELNRGQSAAILGPSGSGKSTLLYLIGTLDHPTRGALQILSTDPTKLAEKELAEFRNRQIGFVFQEHYLLPQCSVLENVLLPALALGSVTADKRDHAIMLLDRVGLGARVSHRPSELSGGERQRTAIARALLQQPALLLADEPTGNLDRTTAATIGKLLIELQASENMMLVVVTHSQELAQLFEKRYELDAGRLMPHSLSGAVSSSSPTTGA